MHIARIQVEEGFLDGLDLSLSPGLVTLIGARGTGKTSIIELIRFCLGVTGYTSELSKRSREHALSVLRSGQVTLTISDGSQTITVARTAEDDGPRSSGQIPTPLIFSQTEIENIGLQAGGRLGLLDAFVGGRATIDRAEAAASAAARSLTLEASSLRLEIEELEGRRAALPGLDQALRELGPQEAQLAGISATAAAKAASLTALSVSTAERAVAVSAVQNFLQSLVAVRSSLIEAMAAASNIDSWPAGTPDLVAGQREALASTAGQIRNLIANIDAAGSAAQITATRLQQERLALEEQARGLRREIDELQAGAGSVMRQAQQLKESKAQLEAMGQALEARRVRFRQVVAKRDEALDDLERAREQRYEGRLAAISALNSALHPRIRLSLTRCGQFEGFANQLSEALRGSGLRYGELSSLLAQRMSPRELVEAVEGSDIDLIAEVAQINSDRALKLVSALKDVDLGALASTLVDDDVCFELLDGRDYKDISDLSTGQRCTVVLPILLQHRGKLLVVDQPEDHIDNAFIADTLILSIKERSADGQIIFSTHNANIPVLGGADRVVEMGSDGKRGFVKSNAPLDNGKSVDAITNVMEGGEAAFEARASFYRDHSLV